MQLVDRHRTTRNPESLHGTLRTAFIVLYNNLGWVRGWSKISVQLRETESARMLPFNRQEAQGDPESLWK